MTTFAKAGTMALRQTLVSSRFVSTEKIRKGSQNRQATE